MGLSGNVKDLSLENMLQVIGVSGQSGILRIQHDRQRAEIVFRHGKIVSARADLEKDLSCDWLVRRGLLDRTRLEQVLDLVRTAQPVDTVAGVLVKRFGMNPKAIAAEAKKEFARAVRELLFWTTGTFSFASSTLEDVAGHVYTPYVLLLAEGIAVKDVKQVPNGLADTPEASSVAAGPGREERAAGEKEAVIRIVPYGMSTSETAPPVIAASPVRSTIFLVDDDPRIGRELADGLSARGWEVKVFVRGRDLLDELTQAKQSGLKPFLLLDLVMPRLNGEGILGGLELLRTVRARHQDLAIRVFSDYYCAETEREVQSLGARKLLVKPHRSRIAGDDDGAMADFIGQIVFALPTPGKESDRSAETARAGSEDSGFDGSEGPCVKDGDQVLRQLYLLKTLTTELRAHDLGEQVWLLLLRFAAEVFDRAAIFSVADDRLRGFGQFGFEGFGGLQGGRLREKLFSSNGTDLFETVLWMRQPLTKRLASQDWNRVFGDWPGGPPALEIFLGPVVCDNKVVAILYGDNFFGGRPVCQTAALEVFLAETGLVMEKTVGNKLCSSH
jgi:CheY-like chemotaxis protein